LASIYYKTTEEIAFIEQSARLVSKTLGILAEKIAPGISLIELDKLAEEFIKDHKAIPGFLGLYNFPNTLCISVNEVVAHGIPNQYYLQEGDIVSVDCGVLKNGFYGDHAYTFQVGEASQEKKMLCKATKEGLLLGIEQLKIGNRLGDVGYAIAQHAKKHRLGVVRELIGHGIGKTVHESPDVPNFGEPGRGIPIYEGLVVALEPMFNLGTRFIRKPQNGWNIKTTDGKPSAHFEHNVAVVEGKPKVLSTFKYIEDALAKKNANNYS